MPEDLGGVIIELMPPLLPNGLFNPAVEGAVRKGCQRQRCRGYGDSDIGTTLKRKPFQAAVDLT
jgi:hypothetical protein